MRANRSFRLLFVAALGSGIGTWFATVAMMIDVYDRTGQSATWVDALLIATLLPTVVVGLFLGSLVDQLPRRRLMIGADLVRFAAFAGLAFVGSPAGIVALAFVAGTANAFFRPAVLAGLPNTVGEASLSQANGLLQSAEFLTTAAGPVAGAALVAATSPGTAYLVNAASFLFSAALLVQIPARLLQSEQSLSRGRLTDIKDGIKVVIRSPALVTVLITFTIVMFPASFMNVAEIALAQRTFGSGNIGFGLLWTATGVGLVVGSIAAARVTEWLGMRIVYPLSLAVFGAGIAATGAAPALWIACLTMIVSGFGNGVLVVSNITLVQTGAPDRLRGRAFTAIISLNYAATIVALMVAGPLTNARGARWTYEIGAAVMAVATVCGAVLSRRISTEVEVPAEPLPVEAELEQGVLSGSV